MTKSEVLRELAEKLDIPQTETEELYDQLMEELTELLAGDKGFTLPGFGSFHPEFKEQHKSYNPHYKQMMMIPPKKVVSFSQSSVLKEEINGEGDE